ncbi:MAG: DUF805 domain-containing protein [Bacteroidales bacterium]|nr:DUF805 domain-containing protein [Bacteroidales bacterium]
MIKDQCNRCKKNGTVNCEQTIVFNSLPCEHYVKRIDLSKSSDKSSASVTNPTQPSPVPQPTDTNSNANNDSFWKSLFSFSGRNRRSTYWLTDICASLLCLPANACEDDMPNGVIIFTLLILIPAIWIRLANITKRCHDLGKSGYFGLLMLIPLVNIFIGIYLAFFKGDFNDNEYGPSPY